MGREPKKDAPPPTAGKPKLLTGVGKFNTDDVKPADVDKDKSKKKKTPKERGEEFGFKLAAYLIAWGLGFIIHLFL